MSQMGQPAAQVQQASQNPYGVMLYPVSTPSGGQLNLQTPEEADWYDQRRGQYLQQNKFPNVSDLLDLDRLLQLEVMVFRWGQWISQGFDYLHTLVDQQELQKHIREYCVDEETEALTRRGWVRFMELRPGEEILTLNPDTGLSEWQVPRTVHTFIPTSPLRRVETRDISALVTEGHRWHVQRGTRQRNDDSPYEFRTTDELDGYCWAPTSALHGGFDAHPKYSDALVELVAWWWTEGSCSRPGLYDGEIAQSHRANPTKVASIRRALLKETGAPGELKLDKQTGHRPVWNETRRGDMTYFSLSKRLVEALEEVAPHKVVQPEFIAALTQGQLDLFIEKSLTADGWVDARFGSWNISQRRREMLESFQIAAVLAGYQANIKYSSSIDMWRMSMSRRTHARPIPATREPELQRENDYHGLVWCPEVSNGVWVCRREGIVHFTGNSREIRELKLALGIDKVSRDKMKGESVPDYLKTLLERAKTFGYHRNKQYETAVTLMYELRSMLLTHDRCDEIERDELDLSEETILEWIRTKMLAEWDELDQSFRENQKIWVREL